MPGEDRSATPIALMEAALARAADEVGDLTQPVMDRLRRRCPDTEATFVRLGLGRPDQLAGQMVETALYCLMSWLDEEALIRVMLHESLPHHCLTLGIEPGLFRALAEETADLVIETIPATCPDERAVWDEIRAGVVGVIAAAAASPMLARLRVTLPTVA